VVLLWVLCSSLFECGLADYADQCKYKTTWIWQLILHNMHAPVLGVKPVLCRQLYENRKPMWHIHCYTNYVQHEWFWLLTFLYPMLMCRFMKIVLVVICLNFNNIMILLCFSFLCILSIHLQILQQKREIIDNCNV